MPGTRRRSGSGWQFSVRELVLLITIVAMAFGYWRLFRSRRFVASPLFDVAQALSARDLRNVRVGDRQPLVGGGGSNNYSPGYATRISRFQVQPMRDESGLGDYVERLQTHTRTLLDNHGCSVDFEGVTRQGTRITGFAFGYVWEDTRGVLAVQSHKCRSEKLHLSVMQFEMRER